MTATRPLYPLHVDILGQVNRLGGATSTMIEGCGDDVSAVMSYLRRQGYLSKAWRVEKRGKRAFRLGLYQLTEKGRDALETGVVPSLVPGSSIHTTFNNRNPAHDRPKFVHACQHHWIIGAPPIQHHRCLNCGAERDQPFTYGGDKSNVHFLHIARETVGARKVRPSERYGAKLMEAGGTAVDLEEAGE